MSNFADEVKKTADEEEIIKLQDEEFLAEQDRKFEELRVKLQSLKEENKRQIDVIINSLDQLMTEKNHIDETLKDLHVMNEHIENDTSTESKHFKVVNYLARVTGYSEAEDFVKANSEASLNENETKESDASEDCKESKMEVVEDSATEIKKENSEEICNEDIGTEAPVEESPSEDSKDAKSETLENEEPVKD